MEETTLVPLLALYAFVGTAVGADPPNALGKPATGTLKQTLTGHTAINVWCVGDLDGTPVGPDKVRMTELHQNLMTMFFPSIV